MKISFCLVLVFFCCLNNEKVEAISRKVIKILSRRENNAVTNTTTPMPTTTTTTTRRTRARLTASRIKRLCKRACRRYNGVLRGDCSDPGRNIRICFFCRYAYGCPTAGVNPFGHG